MTEADRRLRHAGIAFGAASALHVADHLRRGQASISDALGVAGNLALILQVVAVVLVLTGHRLAPIVAVGVGFGLAPGFLAAHWLPQWSALSDPVWEIERWRPLSYVASSAEIVTAVILGFAGLAVVRQRGPASFGRSRAPHP